VKSEKFLTRSLVAALKGSRRLTKRSRVMKEVDCYLGVADVVTMQWSRAFWRNLTPRTIAPLSRPGTALVYALIERLGKVSAEVLVARLGLATTTVSRHLASLRRAKLVSHRKDGTYRIAVPFPHRSLGITAYEAKIEKWQRALYQAARYWSFANQVYVVLPLSRARKLLTNKKFCRSTGMGLMGINGAGALKKLIPSASFTPRSSTIRLRVAARGVLAAQRAARK